MIKRLITLIATVALGTTSVLRATPPMASPAPAHSVLPVPPVAPPEHRGAVCYFIVDRIEGDWAVVEMDIGETVDVPIAYLPAGTREGERLPALPPPDGCLIGLR